MSSNAEMQELCRRIKYVIFDEVHCIGTSEDAVIWEHLLLLIRCPFLALSATIGNPTALHKWLCTAELSKKFSRSPVQLVTYSERYSELELSLQRLSDNADKGCVELNPFGVYVREKLKMFDIPNDQQLTARQILDLYTSMAEFDTYTKENLEPIQYFDRLQKESTTIVRDARVAGTWLSRANLRRLETDLKRRFMQWLDEDNGEKLLTILARLGVNVRPELEYREQPLNYRVALDNIVPLVENLRDRAMLPCICFNDDRRMCERLAQRLHDELEKRQIEFENSDEFKEKYALKDEAKVLKEQKRKRDAKVIKSSKSRGDRVGDRDDESTSAPIDDSIDDDDSDPFLAQKLRASEALERFRLRGRGKDTDMYDKTVARLTKSTMKGRESTKVLLRLLERGIGFHHQGLAKNERDAVEILFRSGHLSIIFSTSTLALGFVFDFNNLFQFYCSVNMPCKTVVFGVDTPMLTPLQFRQMSGRAGRRGFDKSGTVVFMAIPTSKIRRLLTASLSMLRGNVPFTCGFVLRLLTLISANLPDIDQVTD
jgi:superfamily II RNA helicase